MRFLIDAQLPPGLVDRLVQAGHEAEHVNRIGLGSASDAEIWKNAIAAKATLMTKDRDFLSMASSSAFATAVVWIRLGNATNNAIWTALAPMLPDIVTAIESGDRVVEVR